MKIMIRNVIGFFIYILYVAGVKSNSSTKSITQKIQEDTCSTASYVYNSNYTNACRSLTYHSSSIELLKNSTDEFLCLAVFDLSYKICYLDSTSKLQNHKMNLTNNVTIFYDELRLLSATPQLAEHLCKFLQKEHLVVSYDNIESKVSQLNAVLKDSNKCFRICTDFKENVNPLCIILAWADKILTNYDTLIKIEVKEKELNISSVSNVEVDRTKNIVLPGTKEQESQLINANGSTEPGADKASPSSNENVPRDLIRGNTSKLISNNGRLNNEASSVNKNTPIKPSTVHTLPASITKQEENTAVKPPSISNSMNNGINNKGTHLTSNLSSDQSTLHELTQQKGMDRVKEKKFENDINKYSDNISLHQGNLSHFLLTDTNVKTLKLNTILDNSHDHEDTFNEENYDHQDNISPYDLKEGTDLVNDIDDNANQQLPDYSKQRESSPRSNRIRHEDESHFFTYLMILSVLCIGGYVGYHNKQKILAIVLEGRRSRSSRNRRRPSTASYRKLDCTLEEAVTSQCNSNVTHVIY